MTACEAGDVAITQFPPEVLAQWAGGFSDAHLLGQGVHGMVYRAVDPTGRRLAIKKLVQGAAKAVDSIELLTQQLDTLRRVNAHPHLCKVTGYTVQGSQVTLLAYELMANGSLHSALHEDRKRCACPHAPRTVVAVFISCNCIALECTHCVLCSVTDVAGSAVLEHLGDSNTTPQLIDRTRTLFACAHTSHGIFDG